MNKKEAIEFFKNKSFIYEDDLETLQEVISVIEQPPTLAEFLGWEENTEYETEDGSIYRIINDKIYYFNDSLKKWICSSVGLNAYDDLRKMKKAKKVEDKKYCLKHRFLAVGSRKEDLYLAHNKYDHLCLTNDFSKSKTFNEKYAFSICEIEEIKKKYNTDLKDFYLIEVEDEK